MYNYVYKEFIFRIHLSIMTMLVNDIFGLTYDSLDMRTSHVRLNLARCRNYEISSTCGGFPDMAEMRMASWMKNEHEKEKRVKGLRIGGSMGRGRESSDREVDLVHGGKTY